MLPHDGEEAEDLGAGPAAVRVAGARGGAGAVGRTSTQALCHATQPYVLRAASCGVEDLIRQDPAFASALNVNKGQLANRAVAEAHCMIDVLATTR